MLAAACGASSETAAGSSPSPETGAILVSFELLDSDSREVAELFVQQFGDDGLEVLFFAMERGYNYEQIASAIRTNSLDSAGLVAGGEVPSHSRAGIVTLPDDEGLDEGASSSSNGSRPAPGEARLASSSRMLLQDDNSLLSRVLDKVGPDDTDSAVLRLILGIVVSLASAGYSLEQITNALILDPGSIVIGLGGCAFVEDSDGFRSAGTMPGTNPLGRRTTRPWAFLTPQRSQNPTIRPNRRRAPMSRLSWPGLGP